MERGRKRKHSSERFLTSSESSSSPRVTDTERDTQRNRPKQAPGTGYMKNVKRNASAQNPCTSGNSRPPSVNTQIGYECAICLESTNQKEMRTLPCSHAFHIECIEIWLIENTRCPVCRKQFLVDIRLLTFNIKINNASYDMRLTNSGIDVNFVNGDFIRLKNVAIDMRMNNDDGSLRVNEDRIDIKLDDGGFIRLNNGRIDLRLNNVTLQRKNDGIRVSFDNGGFMNFKNMELNIAFD